MKPKFGVLWTIIVVLGMVLSGCTQPAQPTAAPEPKATEATVATAAPKAGKIVIATDAAFPPMEFVDEKTKAIVGFDIDMMNAIAAAMGLEIEYKNTAWDGIFAGLESGAYDAILSSVTITDERKEKYDFSDPYINAGQAVVVLVDNTTIASDKDLSGKTVGAQIGTTGAIAVGKISGVTLKEYDTIDLAFLDLTNGAVEAVVVDTPVAADYALASEQFKGKLKIVGEPFTEEFYGVCVVKGQQAEFLTAFNEGLKKVKADGSYDKIYAKWITGGEMTKPVGGASGGVPKPIDAAIKIGIAAPLSGDVKTFGESTRDGALMAIEEANAAGWKIETVVVDSKCDPQEAANAANKLVFEDKVKYIIGEVCSGASIPISQITEKNKVVQISPTSTNPAVTVNEDGSTKQYVFRACFIDPFQGEVMATLAKDLGAKKAAVLYDVGNDYTKGLAEYFKATFEKGGGQVAVYEAYTKDDTDFSAILGKVAAASPDVLFLPDYYGKNNLIAAQVKEKGIKAVLMGGDGWDSPDLKADLFEGGYFSNHYHPEDPRPILQNFVKAYTAKYGKTPDALAALAYDAARILIQSISEAGVDDATAVAAAMAKVKADAVSGTVMYDAQHNPVKSAAIIQIKGAKQTFFKTVAPAGAAAPAAEAPKAGGVPKAVAGTFKIGIAAPLSGDVKTFGESTRDGALMAFEEANAAGWKIETVVVDSKCDPQEAANAANKLVFEDKVKYIVGEVCSGASIPISQITEKNKVVQISPTSTNPAVTVNEDGSTKQYVFRACFIDPFQGQVMATLAKELGAKKAAVLYDVGNDYTKGLAEYFKATFEKDGGQVVVYEAYTKDDTDFSAILGKVAAASPDVLFLPDYYAKNNLIAAQVKEKGIKAVLMGGDGWDSPDLKADLFEGGYFSNHYHPEDPRPILQNFVKAYTAKYGKTPDALAALAYDAARLLVQGISEAGVDDSTKVAAAMAAIKYDGVSGTVVYDKQHNPVKSAAIIQIKGAKQTFYKTVAPAAAPEAALKPLSEAIKIGIAAPLSGDVKTFGESTRDGALMAIEEANAAGWKIESVIVDSKCDPQEAANAANKLVFEDKVKYIVGEVCSGASIPISQITEKNKVVQISPTSTNPAVTVNENGSTKQYVFRACFIDPFQGQVMATLAKELGAKKAAVLYDVGNDYTKGLAEFFKAKFEKDGGQVVVYEAYTKDDTDFSAILGKVAAASPDVLFLPDYYAKNNLIAAQVKEKGIKAVLMGGDGWDSPDLKADLFEGGYFSNHYHPADPRPILQNFVKAYTAKYGKTPDALAALAYDATRILIQSMSEAGANDATAVAAAMAKIKYDGVSGVVVYDAQHNPVKSAAIIQLKGGKQTFFKTVAP